MQADPLEAAFCYWLSATNGYEKVTVNFGAAYGRGIGVGENSCQAVCWYATAAEKSAYFSAVYNPGCCLKNHEIDLGANTGAFGRFLTEASEDAARHADTVKEIASCILEVLSPVVYNGK